MKRLESRRATKQSEIVTAFRHIVEARTELIAAADALDLAQRRATSPARERELAKAEKTVRAVISKIVPLSKMLKQL